MTTHVAQLDGSPTLAEQSAPRRKMKQWEEMLLVFGGAIALVIMGSVAFGVVASMMFDNRPPQLEVTVQTMRFINSAVNQYQLQHGECPPTLDALVPKFIEAKPLDGWKRPFVYAPTADGANPYTLYSTGASGKDVLNYWQEKAKALGK